MPHACEPLASSSRRAPGSPCHRAPWPALAQALRPTGVAGCFPRSAFLDRGRDSLLCHSPGLLLRRRGELARLLLRFGLLPIRQHLFPIGEGGRGPLRRLLEHNGVLLLRGVDDALDAPAGDDGALDLVRRGDRDGRLLLLALVLHLRRGRLLLALAVPLGLPVR